MSTSAEFQPTWVIDPTAANNRGTGVDAAHPIRDWEELARRLGRGTWYFRQSTSITVQGAMPGSDCIYVPNAVLGQSVQLTLQGASPTVVATGTISSFIPFNVGAQTLDQVAVTWTTGGSSFAPYEKMFMRISSGARAGTIWAIDRDLGSSTAEISNPGTCNTASNALANGFTRTVPVATDPFEIISLPSANCGTLLFGSATRRGTTAESVLVQNIGLTWSSTLNTLPFYKTAGMDSYGPRLNILRCLMSSFAARSNGNMRLMQNIFLDGRYIDGSTALEANLQSPGSSGDTHLSGQGILAIGSGEILDGSILVALANSHMLVDSLRVFRSTQNGITVQAGSKVEFGTDVWGTSNSLVGIHVHSLGMAEYTTAPPTINAGLGLSREVRVGDQNILYSDLPFDARDAVFALRSV